MALSLNSSAGEPRLRDRGKDADVVKCSDTVDALFGFVPKRPCMPTSESKRLSHSTLVSLFQFRRFVDTFLFRVLI